MGPFDDANVSFECPECGNEINKTLGEIKREPEFTCPSCGLPVDANELVSDLKGVEDEWDDLMDALDDLEDLY